MTLLDQQRKAGFIEVAPRTGTFAVLWHVGCSITNVAESENFEEILARAAEWAASEGVPLIRRVH
jgi:hypothetical protein